MKLIDCFYQDGVIDCYSFVFDERDPWTNYHTMLATDHDGSMLSQWTQGFYESGESNPHLGVRPQVIGEVLINHVIGRMCDE